jgi:hypothetical protein
MIPRGALVAWLIVVISGLALSSPKVNSQQFTTSPLVSAATLTGTTTSFYPKTSQTTVLLTQTATAVLSEAHYSSGCLMGYAAFNVTGQSVSVHVSFNAWEPMTLYVIPNFVVQEINSQQANPCNLGVGIVCQTSGLSGDLDVVVSSSQNPYWALLATSNTASLLPPAGYAFATISVGPIVISISEISTSNVSAEFPATQTSTVTSLDTFQVAPVQTSGLSSPAFSTAEVGIALTVVAGLAAIGLVGYQLGKKKRKTS